MEILIRPSLLLLLAPVGVLAVVVLSMLLKQGDWKRKGAALAVAVVVVATLMAVLYRPIRLRVDERGVAGRALGPWQVQWADVRSALYVEDLSASPYRPGVKVGGVALGAYRLGWFRLAGGGTGRVMAEQPERALVLLLHSTERPYVLAPRQVDGLAAAVARYLPVDGWER